MNGRRREPSQAGHTLLCRYLPNSSRTALESTEDNKQRVAATMTAFFDYVASEAGAFRLVFESDLTNEPEVRRRVE